MALDTTYKRRSVSGWPPSPDGDVADEDRQQISGWYSGLLVSAAMVASAAGVATASAQLTGATHVETVSGVASVSVSANVVRSLSHH